MEGKTAFLPGESQYQLANYFNKVYGYACDYVNSKRLDASNITHACLDCGSKQLDIIESQIPTTARVNFPIVTHVLWNKNSSIEKESTILNELKRL